MAVNIMDKFVTNNDNNKTILSINSSNVKASSSEIAPVAFGKTTGLNINCTGKKYIDQDSIVFFG